MFVNDSPYHRVQAQTGKVARGSCRASRESLEGSAVTEEARREPRATCPLSRREFLWRSGGGLGGIALASLLQSEKSLAVATEGGMLSGKLHHPPRAKRVIQMFM